MSKNINENDMGDRMSTGISFGTSGIVNPGVSTFSSPDASQHPINFYPVAANKVDINAVTRTSGPDDEDIKSIKSKVTPDEVITGLDYELKKMTFKNKSIAKEIVISNLKKDPTYYSKLHMLGMEDDLMTENTEKEKKEAFESIFKELIDRRNQIKSKNVDQRITAAYQDSIEKFKNTRGYGPK